MDVLTDVLTTVELRGWLSSRRELARPWRYDFAESRDCALHIVSAGTAYLQIAGQAEPVRVEDGDVLLLPTGHAHSLCDDPRSPLTRRVQLDYSPDRRHQVVAGEGDGPRLLMLCGAFRLAHPGRHPLLHQLPALIHISGSQGQLEEGLADLVRMLARESVSPLPGAADVLRRLTELLFVQAIRLWAGQQGERPAGWAAALRDRPVSDALALMHGSAARRWTVGELAEAVALSRSAFAARFTALVGEPPMAYLTRWRMLKAARLLRQEVSVERIAEELGYESETAFRKAFRRELGVPPAQYRRLR